MVSGWQGTSLALILAALAAPATAQSAATSGTTAPGDVTASPASSTPADSDNGEILVTARKRSESLVNVPEAVTAFSEQKIQQAGIRTLRDFADLTPNLQVTTGQSSTQPQITIRGLAEATGGEAPVAVVIDGVQVSQPAFILQDYGDVQQVEILRGPQGSLYGRNAIGGAINITTRQPTNDLSGRIKLDYGNANTALVDGQLSGAIVADKILFSVTGAYQRTDGQIKNVYLDKRADFGHKLFLHGRLIFNLSDNLKLDLRGDYGHDRLGSLSAEIVTTDQVDDFKPGFLQDSKQVIDQRTIYDMSAKLDYTGSYLTLTSITGYSHVRAPFRGDADFSPAPALLQDVLTRVRAFTEEFRVTSPSTERFRWLLGAFYQNRNTHVFLNQDLDDGTGNAVPGPPFFSSRDIGTSKSVAGFGSASYDILPKLELTVGARYDHDKRNSQDAAFAGSQVGDSFNAFQPKVQLSYKPMPGFNIYATYSKGFSSGGFNAFFAPGQREFAAERAENFEAGVKGSFANGRLSFAADAFHVTYDNQQFYFINLNPLAQNVINIDRTRVNGVEVELTAHPVPQLDLTANYGLSDAKIRKFAAVPDDVGNRAPQNNKYTLTFSGQYSIPLRDQLDLRAYASYHRQGSEYWDVGNQVRTPAKDFVDLRLFLEGRSWTLGGFVKNLTNAQYPTLVVPLGGDLNIRAASERRTYGAEASYRF